MQRKKVSMHAHKGQRSGKLIKARCGRVHEHTHTCARELAHTNARKQALAN